MAKKQSQNPVSKRKPQPPRTPPQQDPSQSFLTFQPHQTQSQYEESVSFDSELWSRMGKLRAGRPRAHQKLLNNNLKYNQVDLIKNCFVYYLEEIGYRQGLVFTVADRLHLQKQQNRNQKNGSHRLPQIKWDNTHQWDPQQELIKIKNILKQQQIPQIFIYENLPGHLLDIADIFPRQVTTEIYRLLCKLYAIVLNLKSKTGVTKDQQTKEFVEEILKDETFYFIVGKFSNSFKPKKDNITEDLDKLCHNIVKYIRQLIKT